MEFLTIEQIKRLSVAEASEYCDKIRRHLVETVAKSGGHLASNLGVAEISMACVRVLDLPSDSVIYDVGHQSYVHKILTGRFLDENNLRVYGKYSGFTKRDESEYDAFGAGHSSTALSAAVGFAKAAKLKGENKTVVAVVGDGAFCTGMTFEAINNIDHDDKIIIILNDNEMSISRNVGSFSNYLIKIRSAKKYLKLKRQTKKAFLKIPLVGTYLSAFAGFVKNSAKSLVVKNTFFEELGIEYIGPADGNDLATVERLLSDAKSMTRPILLHLCTQKGKGFKDAEDNPGKYHAVTPSTNQPKTKSFSEFFGEYIVSAAEKDKSLVAVTAAMCDGTGLNTFKNKYPNRFFDVGICEEHAVTFCASMNAGGLNPCFAVYSTFFQRCYDQLLHDVSLQNLKITLALDRAGFSSHDGPTHHGVFDVSLLMSVPGIAVYSPATFDEMSYSFKEADMFASSVAVRYPKGGECSDIKECFEVSDFALDEKKSCDILLITYGKITSEVIKSKKNLEKQGYSCVILKFLKLKPIDFAKVYDIIKTVSPKYVFVVEEGIRSAGFGEHIFANIPTDINKCDIIAISDNFVPFGTLAELYDFAGISATKITEKIIQWITTA